MGKKARLFEGKCSPVTGTALLKRRSCFSEPGRRYWESPPHGSILAVEFQVGGGGLHYPL